MNSLEYSFFKHCAEEKLLIKGDRVIISLSGGSDSTALLHLIRSVKKQFSLDILIVHFNHKLRIESFDEERKLIRDALKHQTPIITIKNNSFQNKGIQLKARIWRREELLKLKKQFNFTKIATAHHIEDLAESQLWRMVRGGSLFTFDALKSNDRGFVRPLLNIRKDELKQYLISKNIPWSEDQSNQENKYTRNKLRNNVLPELENIGGKHFLSKLKHLADDAKLLDKYFKSKYCNSLNSTFLSYEEVIEAQEFFGKELIHQFLIKQNVLEIKREIIKNIFQLIHQRRNNWSINLHGSKIAKGLNFKFFVELSQ